MKNLGRKSLYILLVSFIVIQFFRPEMNRGGETNAGDLFSHHPGTPDDIRAMISHSCYNCHSNNTDYPWYAQVAPFSWIISQHISNGKAGMNLSEYGLLSDRQRIALLDGICESVSDSSMPPANYLMFHSDAALDLDDITAICDWTDQAAFDLMTRK